MRAVILISAGRHPVSGTACAVPVELQAIGLARRLGAQAIGLHAGPSDAALREAIGHGLDRAIRLDLAEDHDPAPALAAALGDLAPDLVLAGRRGQGGEESGLLPYRLARALGRPIIADAAALAVETGGADRQIAVDQARPGGARMRIRAALPALVTLHPSAPPAPGFAHARARRGTIETWTATGPMVPREGEIRPYRRRPKLTRATALAGDAAERLAAVTALGSGSGHVLIDPDPEDAARAILAHLKALGLVGG